MMLKCFSESGLTNWACNIRNILNMNGFGYVWENQRVDNEEQFISSFNERLKDQWSSHDHDL